MLLQKLYNQGWEYDLDLMQELKYIIRKAL